MWAQAQTGVQGVRVAGNLPKERKRSRIAVCNRRRLVMSDLMHSIFEEFSATVFVTHVDDMGHSRESEDEDELADELARVRGRVQN